jgi:hypothetical protein
MTLTNPVGLEESDMLNWREPGRHQNRMMETLNIIFAQHGELLEFLFEKDCPRLRQEPEVLLERSWGYSSGQQILIRTALDLWSGGGDVKIWQVIEGLDDSTYENVLLGLLHLRRIDDDGPEMRWRQPKMAY